MKPNTIQIPIGYDEEFDEANVTLFMEVDQITGLGACWSVNQDGVTLNVARIHEADTESEQCRVEILGHYEGAMEDQVKQFQSDFGSLPPEPPTLH